MHEMKEHDKLYVLLQHWLTHNDEHVAEYRRWATIMDESGEQDLAEAMSRLVSAGERLSAEMEKAFRLAETVKDSKTP